jgi:serine/threonine protein kinase
MLLDNQGKLRLCDFGEARYADEDEHIWDGSSTLHFESPNRLLRGQQFRGSPPPPVIEDDLYGLGLSIWQLYTGGIPHEDIAGDDLDLMRDNGIEKPSTWLRYMIRRLVILLQAFFVKEELVFSAKGRLLVITRVFCIGNRILFCSAWYQLFQVPGVGLGKCGWLGCAASIT